MYNYSNTTLVKVKLYLELIQKNGLLIQIQHLLKLNKQKDDKAGGDKLIQIQHLLKLNHKHKLFCA